MKNIVIIGAGYGGLVASALLAKEGHNITVIEKNEQPGGKASLLVKDGFQFDMGPSWYMWPQAFQRFFDEFDEDATELLELKRLDPSYRVFFDDGDIVDISSNVEKNYKLTKKVVIITQARMTSTRLPGKVLMLVEGKPLLQYHLERLREVSLADELIVATTENKTDDPIVELCKSMKVKYFRGSEDDVLSRYFLAAKKYKANVGISFDGDADRIIMCDEKGKIIDGDQIIAMLARRWKLKRILKGGVIGTLMSNYGLENFLKNEKIKFFRSKVGDRYVKEKMKKLNFNLGGEQSGHIILGKFATTGDGLMVALEVLFSLRKGKKASNLLNVFKPLPQILENVVVKDKGIVNKPKCKTAIKKANKLMGYNGRLLVRKSGTEPKIRIMAESYDRSLILKCIKIIKRSIK